MNEQIEQQIKSFLEDSFLKPFLLNESITDISYNGENLYVQDNKKGRYKSDFQPSDNEVLQLGKKIADIQGKEFTNTKPILDTEIAHFRVNFVHHSVSPSGCTFAIRVSRPKLAIQDTTKLAPKHVMDLLEVLIKGEMNTIIAGETGAGKTELQKLLVGFIPNNKKITVIEDTMDSHIKALYPEKDINSWRTLTDDTRENKIYYSDLLMAGLRNNPNWMIIAETRGPAAYHMVESALTDHKIITTIHAKGAESIPSRLLSMIGRKYSINELLFGKDIVNVLPIGIYLSLEETEEGIHRYIREIVEFTDYTEKGVEYINLYKFEREYNEETGKYEEKIITNPLSEETLSVMKFAGLYHLIPEPFRNKKITLEHGVVHDEEEVKTNI